MSDPPASSQLNIPHRSDWHIWFRQILVDYFSEDELEAVCFDLRVDYESLGGEGKAKKAIELVEHFARLGRVIELIDHCSRLRPNIPWSELRAAAASNPLIVADVPDRGLSDSTPDQQRTRRASSGRPRALPYVIGMGAAAVALVIVVWLFVVRSQGNTAMLASPTPTPRAPAPSPQATQTPTSLSFDSLRLDLSKDTIVRETGLEKNCIRSQYWIPLKKSSSSADSGTCLDLSGWGISPQENGLVLSREGPAEETRQGIYTPITDNSIIEFKLIVYTLFTFYDNNLANLAVGVIPTNPVDLTLDAGQLFYQKESPQDGYPIFIKYQERGGFDRYISKDGVYLRYKENTLQQVVILIKDGQLNMAVDGYPVEGPVYLPFSEKAFWIGYRLPSNGKVRAYISDLLVRQK